MPASELSVGVVASIIGLLQLVVGVISLWQQRRLQQVYLDRDYLQVCCHLQC